MVGASLPVHNQLTTGSGLFVRPLGKCTLLGLGGGIAVTGGIVVTVLW